MSTVLPRFKQGPTNYQVSTLIYGGMIVAPTTLTAGTTDLTVKPAPASSVAALGIAGNDANVLAAQTGSPNSYGQPQIDISVLQDYTPVYYGGWDVWAWYANTAAIQHGDLVRVDTTTAGTLTTIGAGAFGAVVGRCTHPGGITVAMCNQQIGGQGAATFFLGRVRIF